ncbi:putative N-acetyltransferase YoaA [Psilocybe cubensis]|uniref:N-acetyltransferase YoaA n=1 Tax=Psilocybe cubensis TaxID=181762 RepID=A0ACB8GXT7_PSICU|nr:putative N-acetyltransferase YoaA [Psilocybe cubensis]KAH9480284.1 putative N-acetyltransferase YoaA [Psilocybe cubensis]
MFTTARLRLRGSTPNDADNLLALYNDPRVAPWITEGYIVPKHASYLETINAFIASCVLSCVVEELESGEFVGLCSFVGQGEAKNRNAIMCIALLPRHWSKGYGAEVMGFLIDYAFHDMGMHRVSLTVFEGNERAMALYRRLGFVEEGRHRKIVWMNGGWKDTYYMGILEDEWRERKQRQAEAEQTFLSRWIMSSLPTHIQIPYEPPFLPVLLSLAAYLYLLSTTNALSESITNAPLLGPLLTGILLGPSVAGLITPALQESLIALGYIGLLLIVFEAGLSTHLPLLFANAGLSCAAALTGILVPIALSMALLKSAYGYTSLQSFAAGAALCSTSLGTTLALLTPPLRRTRVGSVLMAAALLDDIVGLVIAGIIPGLAGAEAGGEGVKWETIVRPILVSIAFGAGTPALAWIVRKSVLYLMSSAERAHGQLGAHLSTSARIGRRVLDLIQDTRTQLFLTVLALSAFVAGTKYAGTSELFGAYLAGALLAYIFTFESLGDATTTRVEVNDAESPKSPSVSPVSDLSETTAAHAPSSSPPPSDIHEPESNHYISHEPINLPFAAFTAHLQPILAPLLGPIFFASIGAAIPVGSLFTIHIAGGGVSHAVVWKGLVYALLMVLAKMVVGVWMLVWPAPRGRAGHGRKRERARSSWLTSIRAVWDKMKKLRSKCSESENGLGYGCAREASTVEEGGVCEHSPDTAKRGRASTALETRRTAGSEHHDEHDLGDGGHVHEPSPRRAAALLGLAMVARGEIALIVAQLARPLLVDGRLGLGLGGDEEPYAVVIWAIVVSTFGGAVGVGMLLGSWRRRRRDGGEEVSGVGFGI